MKDYKKGTSLVVEVTLKGLFFRFELRNKNYEHCFSFEEIEQEFALIFKKHFPNENVPKLYEESIGFCPEKGRENF